MPVGRELRDRMDSIRETRKITNAMNMIASTKLQWAQRELNITRPYFDALRFELMPLFRAELCGKETRFFPQPNGALPFGGVPGILAFTADRGLAGPYNMNVIRHALRLLEEEPSSRLFVVGDYGRHYFKVHGIPFEEDFQFSADKPTVDRARLMCNRLLGLYEDEALNAIHLIYTDMRNRLSTDATAVLLLPLPRGGPGARRGAAGGI